MRKIFLFIKPTGFSLPRHSNFGFHITDLGLGFRAFPLPKESNPTKECSWNYYLDSSTRLALIEALLVPYIQEQGYPMFDCETHTQLNSTQPSLNPNYMELAT